MQESDYNEDDDQGDEVSLYISKFSNKKMTNKKRVRRTKKVEKETMMQ